MPLNPDGASSFKTTMQATLFLSAFWPAGFTVSSAPWQTNKQQQTRNNHVFVSFLLGGVVCLIACVVLLLVRLLVGQHVNAFVCLVVWLLVLFACLLYSLSLCV
jgi:Flp pilus assembly protein TadB